MIRQGGVYIRLRIVVVVIRQDLYSTMQFMRQLFEFLFVFPRDSRASSFEDASEAIKSLLSVNQSLKKDMKKSQSEDLGSSVKDLINKSLNVEGYNLITNVFENLDSKELRETADRLRNQSPNSVIALISISEDKAPAIVACSKEVDIDAREVMKHLINQLGGSGGGRPDFAQGGIDNTDDVDIALSSIGDLIVSLNNQ